MSLRENQLALVEQGLRAQMVYPPVLNAFALAAAIALPVAPDEVTGGSR